MTLIISISTNRRHCMPRDQRGSRRGRGPRYRGIAPTKPTSKGPPAPAGVSGREIDVPARQGSAKIDEAPAAPDLRARPGVGAMRTIDPAKLLPNGETHSVELRKMALCRRTWPTRHHRSPLRNTFDRHRRPIPRKLPIRFRLSHCPMRIFSIAQRPVQDLQTAELLERSNPFRLTA